MQSAGVVTVSANDNNVDAADKAVTVSGVAANTQGVAGNPPDLALTIRDDEETPRVELVLGTDTINENAGSTTVKATIPHPSSHETVVTLTAVAGAFTVGGTLTIPAGSTESPTATLTAVDNEDRRGGPAGDGERDGGERPRDIEPGRGGADDHRR